MSLLMQNNILLSIAGLKIVHQRLDPWEVPPQLANQLVMKFPVDFSGMQLGLQESVKVLVTGRFGGEQEPPGD